MIRLYICLLLILPGFASYAQSLSSSKSTSIGKSDTLFFAGQWDKARAGYEAYAKDHPDKMKALTWNRLGFCYHNLGGYREALKYYQQALASGPSPQLKPYLDSRIARSHSLLKETDQALRWLDSASVAGYSNLMELDTLKDFDPIRLDKRFEAIHQKIFSLAYPCSQNPKNREFDFWIGDWDVYQTGTTSPKVGHSVIQKASGGCMILENWTALQGSHEGKSINYYDPAAGQWEQDWIGSDGTPVKFVQGVYKDEAMRFVFESVQSDGSKWPGRFTFFNQGQNQVRQFSEHSPDGGKTWQTNYDFTYIRRSR